MTHTVQLAGIILQRTKSIDYSTASSPTESDAASLQQSETSEVSEDTKDDSKVNISVATNR